MNAEGCRINVLYELPFANLGGTEKHVLTLIRALGREVTPCLLAPQGEALSLFSDEGVPYQVIDPLTFAPGVRRSLKEHRAVFRHLLEDFGFSLVHVHGGIEYAVAAKLACPGIPVVFTIHGYPDTTSYVVSGFLANRIADEVICVSDWERSAATKYGFRGDRLTLIHNGVAPPRPTGKAREFRREWGIQDAAFVVGTVSRLERRKGLTYLISAISQVRKERPDVVLLVVGTGSKRRQLERFAQDLGVRENVVFTGALRDPTAAIEATDIFALASLQEALGIAILEAMALAKPVVATSVGGIPEAVTHRETGLLVPPKDDAALASALLELARDPARRREYGERGRRRLEAHFTAELMASRTLEVYRRALARKKASPV